MPETKDNSHLRALAQTAAAALPSLPEAQRRLVLAGIVELPIPEAEDASRLLALLQAADEAQAEFFQALGLPRPALTSTRAA